MREESTASWVVSGASKMPVLGMVASVPVVSCHRRGGGANEWNECRPVEIIGREPAGVVLDRHH